MKSTITFFIACGLLFFGCKSAQKLYEKGNYEKATYAAADAVRKAPADQQARTLMQNAYMKAVQQYDSIIKHNSASKKGENLDVIYNSYVKLQQLSQTVRSVDSTNKDLVIKDYAAEIKDAAQQAADYRYQKGTAYLQKGGKQNAQKAYHNFEMVEKYLPGYKDVSQKIQQASDAASTNIVISTFDQRFGIYRLDGSFLQQNILWNLNDVGSDRMNYFYSEADAQMKKIRVDQFMNLTFYGIYFSPVYSNSYNYTVTKDLASPDGKALIPVSATVYVTRQIINSRMTMDCRITDATNRIIYTNSFPADYTWNSVTATYTGDQRALGPSDWALINSNPINQPAHQQIYQTLTQQIINDFIFRMRSLYS